jgi:NCAIR mutase (PurE)-related protein
MDIEKLRQLLKAIQQGQTTVDEAMERLRQLPYEDLGYARLDLHRALRNAMPEVVFCQGKTIQQATAILEHLWQHHDRVMGTRVSPEMAEAILKEIPGAHYDPLSRLVTLVHAENPVQSENAP